MSKKVKDINMKSRTYYFFNIISIENFVMNSIKMDEKSYKNIFNNYTGYVTIKKDLNGYFEGIKGNMYLTLVPTNESKEENKIWRTIE